MAMPPVMWTPRPEQAAPTHMRHFMESCGFGAGSVETGAHTASSAESYEQLYRWSIAEPGAFWKALWDYAGVIGEPGERAFVRDSARPMTGSQFFPEATVNLAENLLRGDDDALAVIQADETGAGRTYTRAELRAEVGQAQRVLLRLGVRSGDRVAGIVPNTVSALAYTLASLSIGAVWTSCAPEFGRGGVLDRFGQVSPKVLVVAESYVYNGKRHQLAEKALGIAGELPSLDHVLILGDAGTAEGGSPRSAAKGAPGGWREASAAGGAGAAEARSSAGTAEVHRAAQLADDSDAGPDYAQLPFHHPAYVVYTSGTTGLPKSIVHRTGGILLNLLKEHLLHSDVRAGDRMLYYTNTAWMMYHWSIAALGCGATVVLYDGAAIPAREPGILWRLAGELGATHFGTSPKYLSTMAKQGISPRAEADLEKLRFILSAGAPLTEDNFTWVYSEVKEDLLLASISGGTEILGCFVLGNPLRPVRSGEIQGPGLGMAVAALDERQIPVQGRPGDLVCTEPFPSMPLTFWGEDGDERYRKAYFAEKEEVWHHGDLIEFRASGGVVISGRTDTTLKPGGVRIGTSEIYRVVETDDAVADSLVIGYPTEGDMEIWLFAVPEEGRSLDVTGLKKRLRSEASPRHVPARVFVVEEIPYNLAGKKVEGAVLKMVTGKEVTNRDSLSNPGCLAQFREPNLPRIEIAAEVPGAQGSSS